MSRTDSKKAVLATYEVLKRFSSWEQPLSITKIIQYIKMSYDLEVSRNTLTDTLNKLREFYGDEVVCCSETPRLGSDGQENFYTYGYYFDRDAAKDILTDEDILKLVEVCLYARNLTAKEAKGLIGDLKNIATSHLRKTLDYTDDIPEKQFNTNKKTSDNLRLLHEVISENRGRKQQWVRFWFNYYNADRDLIQYKDYVVFPLHICEANHKYYLLCAMEGSREKIYHYRIDLMTKLKKESHRTIDGLEELKKNFSARDISDYMSSHLYMFYDTPRIMELEIPKSEGEIANLTFLADAFGLDSRWRVKRESEDAVVIGINCSPNAMKIFIMQYAGRGIRVVTDDVRKEINDAIKKDCEQLLNSLKE